MADNTPLYGFRWAREWNGTATPSTVRMTIATATTFDVNSSGTANLNPGDPVELTSGGGVDLCDGAEATPGLAFGIVAGFEPYYNATTGLMTPARALPSAVAWGTVESRRTWVHVIPTEKAYWEIDVDDAVTATTFADYVAFIGENADHVLTLSSDGLSVNPRLDISGHATSATLGWRIVGVSRTKYNKDFAGAYVKLIVQANEGRSPIFNPTTGV